jgi:predicted Zn-dependent protease
MRLSFHGLCMAALLAASPTVLAADTAAIEPLERAAFENPDNPTLQGELADAYYEIYRTSRDPIFEELSIAQYRKFLALRPGHDGAMLALYTLQYAKLLRVPRPDLLRALREIFGSISADARDGVMPPSTMQAVSLLLAVEKGGSIDIDRESFRTLLKNGIRESPRFGETYFMLARSYNINHEYDAEIAVLRQAMFMLPDHPEARKKLATALDDRLDGMECYVTDPHLLDDTIQAWQNALAVRPEDAEIHRELLFAYELKGQFALQLFEARTLYKLTNSAEDRLLLADSLVSAGYLDAAVEMYEAIRKRSSALTSLKRNIGTAYFYRRKPDAAARHLAAYLRESPDHVYGHITLALAETARGNGEEVRYPRH